MISEATPDWSRRLLPRLPVLPAPRQDVTLTWVPENRMSRWTRSFTLNRARIGGVAVIALGLWASSLSRPAPFSAALQNTARSVHFTDDFENGRLDAWQMP